MKRWMAWLAVMVLCVCLTACGKDPTPTPANGTPPTVTPQTPPTPLTVGETVTAGGYAQFTLLRAETTQKIQGSMGDTLYYENKEEGKTYVDMVFDAVNLGGAVKPDGLMKLSAVGDDGKAYDAVLYAYESADGFEIVRYMPMEKDVSYRYHAALVVPDTTKTLDLTLTVGSKRYTYSYTLGERVSTAKPMALGDTFTAANGTQLTLKDIRYADRVDPSQAGTYYTYYSVDDENNTYLAVTFDVLHTQQNGILPSAVVGVTADYDGVRYAGFYAVEKQNGQGFITDDPIPSGETRTLYCLIEVPKEITQQTATLYLSFDKQEYTVQK